jgi:aminoglycoside phosphotransferase (APT) family kinase protein
VWRQHPSPSLGDDEIVCHGDVGPHNTVYRGGIPVGLIDWDGIRPNHPVVEFGTAAWLYVPLANDAYFEASTFPSRPDLTERLALFAREYGVADRAEAAWALHQAKQRSVEAAKYWPISPAEGAAVLRLVASELEWLHGNLPRLVSKLR